MRPNYIVFDFDGTIMESAPGITGCVRHALVTLGFPEPDEATLLKFIGPPLHPAFCEFTHLTEAQADEALKVYRERYAAAGLFEARVYPGIAPLLRALKADGRYLAIASSKPEALVKRIAAHFGLDGYFDRIIGAHPDSHSADKRSLILSALPENANPAEVCVVGDRCFDIDAGRALQMHTIAVEYGYGNRAEFLNSGAEAIAESAAALGELLEAPKLRGKMISFEGSDGCGKSTQIQLLAEYLTARGEIVNLSREPGGCPISERIREIILSLDSKGMSAECEALLYAAARVEHVKETILPALQRGEIVLCDRYLDSSFAYQASGRELGDEFVRQINKAASDLAQPDRTLLFDISRETARKRMAGGAPLDRLEIEKEDFFRRVAERFDRLARENPDRIRRIDSGRSIEEVFRDVIENI